MATLVGCCGATDDVVESSVRARPFAEELEVAAGTFAKGVVTPAYEEDKVCAFVLPLARGTGCARSSCRRPEVSDDDLWLGGW